MDDHVTDDHVPHLGTQNPGSAQIVGSTPYSPPASPRKDSAFLKLLEAQRSRTGNFSKPPAEPDDRREASAENKAQETSGPQKAMKQTGNIKVDLRRLQESLANQPAVPCGGRKKRLGLHIQAAVCDECSPYVYDFSGQDEQSALRMVYRREGIQQAEFFLRPDGKFMTKQCPAAVRRKKQLALQIIVGAVTYLFLIWLFWHH
jgi:hypothetical protein